MKIYVASSWRNPIQPAIVHILRANRHEVYDFRNPAEDKRGFGWREIDPDWRNWSMEAYVEALGHERAEEGYTLDMDAMEWADVGVLVLGAGSSAHLELGWFAGNPNKRSIIMLQPTYNDDEASGWLKAMGHSLGREVPCSACGDLDGCHLWRQVIRAEYFVDRPFEPELMYKMADAICLDVDGVLRALETFEIDDQSHHP